ncbi:hypothetical protein [Petroclostridium sp. X23]|uniref:retroviral-like aspartic protease family protein n=1 Tax=Petroclostridium sp. X23 TaxID=3045146 RepID=UPI0032C09B98
MDTGAFHTIILADYLAELDVGFSDDDKLVKACGYGGIEYSSVRKRINRIEMGDIFLENIKLDFGVIDPKERVNELVGLDFLKQAGLVIDFVELNIYSFAENSWVNVLP